MAEYAKNLEKTVLKSLESYQVSHHHHQSESINKKYY